MYNYKRLWHKNYKTEFKPARWSYHRYFQRSYIDDLRYFHIISMVVHLFVECSDYMQSWLILSSPQTCFSISGTLQKMLWKQWRCGAPATRGGGGVGRPHRHPMEGNQPEVKFKSAIWSSRRASFVMAVTNI